MNSKKETLWAVYDESGKIRTKTLSHLESTSIGRFLESKNECGASGTWSYWEDAGFYTQEVKVIPKDNMFLYLAFICLSFYTTIIVIITQIIHNYK